ncbi:ATP-binding protein [Cetobacterium sp. SF1]|uniref:ATP-binding protein n=1 Tax=Cetobacterium sp. SF1 TaxID=3417654 RepID=UPI003CEE5F7D
MKINSIFFKLPMKIIIVFIFLSFSSYFFIINTLKKDYHIRTLERLKSFSINLEWTLYPLYENKDFSTIQRLIEKQSTLSYVDTIALINEDYYTVISNSKDLIGRFKNKEILERIFANSSLIEVEISPNYDFYTIILPLNGNEFKLHNIENNRMALYIKFDMTRENFLLYKMQEISLLTIVIMIIFSIIFNIIILKKEIFNPLISLKEGFKEVTSGNYSYYIPYHGKTFELKEIIRNFNSMILRIKITTEKLKISEQKALNSAKAKSAFLANMTHELRSPLNSIMGYCNLLLEDEQNSENKAKLNSILGASNHLLSVINDILNYSKLESKKQILNIDKFNLESLIEEINSIFSIISINKNLTFIINKKYSKEIILKGDSIKIKEIIINLLSNAFKFTEKGSVILNLEFNNNFLFVEVIDSGIGIPEDKKDTLFKPFEQIEMTKTKNYGGTGLGLSISRELVELMGGFIGLESILGKGSKFYFKIPLEETKGDILNKPSIPMDNFLIKDISNNKILIVDDIEDNQIITKLMLKKFNFDFDFASNGLEALEKIKNNSYLLVFLDIQMPIMNGLEVLQNLQNFPKPYIFALTAYSGQEELNEILSAGANDIITKPLNKEILIKKVNTYLESLIKEY